MDEIEALAICYGNLKGSKDKDLIITAKALRFLKKKYKSNAALGKLTGVSGEIVREFIGLLDLPEGIQELLDARVLKLEHGRRLRQLARQRPTVVQEVADAIANRTAHEARYLVDYMIKHPDLAVTRAIREVEESKGVIEEEFHVVALLNKDSMRRLEIQAKRDRHSVSQLVTKIVQDWLRSRETES